MRTRGWRIGRIGGAPLILTPGSVILGALLYVVFLPTFQQFLGDGAATFVIAALLPLALLVSILIHEVAHGLSARAFNVPVTEYVLTLWGGHTAFDRGVERPGPSAIISIAGPAANAVLAGLAWLPIVAGRGSALDVMLAAVVYVNAILAVFNLLPALPMDGGRILEALVWAVTGTRTTGTMVAARLGQVLAVAVAVWGAWPLVAGVGAPIRMVWALLIAGVLWVGAQGEVKRARAQRATAGADLSPMVHPVLVLPESATVADWDRAGGSGHITVVTSADGAPAAMVQPQAAASVPPQSRAGTALPAVSSPVQTNGVLRTTRGTEAVSQVARAAQAGVQTMVVTTPDEHGRAQIAGAIAVERVIRSLGA